MRENAAPLMVFADDGSPGSDVAWLWINNHPWEGWRIESLTGHQPDEMAVRPPPGGGLREWSPPWDRHVTVPDGLASLRFLTGDGDPRVLLGDRADAELIVVGPRGLGHLRALWSGSTTEWLLHHPPAPLAIIRSAAPVRSVVACVDGSDHARAAVEAFLALPLAADTAVTVLGVGRGDADVERGIGAAAALVEEAGVPVGTEVLEGKPTAAICGHVEEHRPQLVVLGTRGLTGLDRLKLGSTAAAIARDVECSSLVASAD